MSDERKRLPITILIFLIILTSFNTVAFAEEAEYAAEDIAALSELAENGNNNDILGWDLTDPNSIEEVIWELEDDGKYHIVSLSLSGMDISGTADLKNCLYLENVSFTNSNIENVFLPSNLVYLDSSSFSNCSSLTFVEINSEELLIYKNTFSGCVNLKTLLNTDAITTIGANAFNNCSNVRFYGNDTNSYAADYARTYHISYTKNKTVTAYCYIGIMTDSDIDTVNLENGGTPYHTGYITTEYGTFYSDETGKIEFDIDLGSSQTAVVNGTTALNRTLNLDVLSKNNCFAENDNAIGVVVCDYVKDGYINAKDFAALLHYTINSNTRENYCYDLNSNGEIDDFDKAYFQEFISTGSDPTESLYISWR